MKQTQSGKDSTTPLLALLSAFLFTFSACTLPSQPTNTSADGSGDSGSATFVVLPALLVADSQNHRLVGMDDLTGTNWSEYVLPNAGTPVNFALDWNGAIYISDATNSVVIRINDLTGAGARVFGAAGSGVAQFNNPRGIAFDSQGRIYIADSGNNRIVRIDDLNGTNWTTFGAAGNGVNQFNAPIGIQLDPNDRIYVTDSGNNRLVRVDDLIGTNWTTLGTNGNGVNQFSNPTGLSLNIVFNDFTGNSELAGILVADTGNNRIALMADASGAGWITFGAAGNGVSQFNSPQGVNAFWDGSITIGDTGNDRVVHIDSITGAAWTAFGSAGSAVGQFSSPRDVLIP